MGNKVGDVDVEFKQMRLSAEDGVCSSSPLQTRIGGNIFFQIVKPRLLVVFYTLPEVIDNDTIGMWLLLSFSIY